MLKHRTISATEFKAKCLSILEQLDSRGVVVTKHGRPLARVLPARPHANERLIGSMKGRIKVKGDIFSTVSHARPARSKLENGASSNLMS